MPQTLHILNGMSSLTIFNKSGIEGEAIAWNEILCEGPSLPEISSPEQEVLRKTYTEDQFSGHDYDEIVWGIWDFLAGENHFDEIVCWYEYDLFCQINFMAMIHWLAKNRPGDKISIICSGVNVSGKLKGLGEYVPEDYPKFYQGRQLLTSSQKEQASAIWRIYCSGAHDQLLSFSRAADLPYLAEAIEAHLRRFPWTTDHLNEHQRQILSWIRDGTMSDRQLVGKCLRNNGFYGFGDLQCFNMINALTPCIDWKNGQLTPYGNSLMEGGGDIDQLPASTYGGTSSNQFRYDPIKKQLITWPQ
ncbi:MAG: hypothetical protein RIC80_01665 [Cyclobacteriaceae bacterium]